MVKLFKADSFLCLQVCKQIVQPPYNPTIQQPPNKPSKNPEAHPSKRKILDAKKRVWGGGGYFCLSVLEGWGLLRLGV